MTPISPSSRQPLRRTVRRPLAVAAILALAGPLAACVPNPLDAFNSSTETVGQADSGTQAAGRNPDKGAAPASTFTQFNDIPIPAGADLDLEQSLVLGTEEGWIGRLSLDVKHGMTDMYSFYEREMPKFSWEQLTTVRAKISTMTYRRGARVATITLQSSSGLAGLGSGTSIDFTVAPANRTVTEGGLVRR
jgi:hypothetical protein